MSSQIMPESAVQSVATRTRAPWIEASILSGAYLLIAGAYVLVSTRVAADHVRTADALERIELMKGLGFIFVTALALGFYNFVQITRLRRNDAQFRRMDHAMQNAERSVLAGTFASTVAHDVNNGLMAAMLALEELHDRLKGSEELLILSNDARAAVARVSDWNRRYFDLSGDRLLKELRPFDLVQQLRSTAEMARHHGSFLNVELEVVMPPQAPFRGSDAMMQRAVLNLLLNAAEAAGGGQRVRLELSQAEHGRYCIAVDDSGPGVPAEMRDKIMEPFYTSKASGTGLGLASVAACTALHHGVITINASPLGGARFTLTLP